MKRFFDPTAEHLDRLSGPWCCSYSGGKDSTSLVTWIEWLRRAGWLTVDRPQLVQADTGVEDIKLADVSADLRALLIGCGWDVGVVVPEVHERLYCQILGRGLPPIHPGIRRMRWCTRSTKIDPMDRWKTASGGAPLWLTGLRLGESAMRDGKLLGGCAAGGECGIPEPRDDTYSPIVNWTTCHVIDWLSGHVGKDVKRLMVDVFAVTRRLVDVYEVEIDRHKTLFGKDEVEVSAARFGCTGCPAISAERYAPARVVARYGTGSPLNELYDVWHEARLPKNRLFGGPKNGLGPLLMSTRQRLFDRVMDIQRRAGIVLITPEDEAFIRQCWEMKTYPRGWSEADELTEEPIPPLYGD